MMYNTEVQWVLIIFVALSFSIIIMFYIADWLEAHKPSI